MKRCVTCWKELGDSMPDMVYNSWLKLMDYIWHELLEGEITEATYEDLSNALMAMKAYLPSETEE